MSDELYPHTTLKIQQPDGSVVCCTNCVGCAFEAGIAEAISDMRDEIAMSALTGMLSSEYYSAHAPGETSAQAYVIADAMLAAREEP